MSHFSFAEMQPAEIVNLFVSESIGPENLAAEHIAAPTSDLLADIFRSFLVAFDPFTFPPDDPDGQMDFEMVQHLDNPEFHDKAIRMFRLYDKIRRFLELIQFDGFTFQDLLHPNPRRTLVVLSALANFLMHRREKLGIVESILNEYPNSEERRVELKERIAQLKKEIDDHEHAMQMEEPVVQQVDAEVQQLRQTVKNYNNQQLALKVQNKALKEKNDAIDTKITQADVELMKLAQENVKLSAKIVQSPEKLQRMLEEKKSARVELKNADKIAMLRFKDKTSKLEIYTKASEKLSKHLLKIQAIHEQVMATKAVEKEVKAMKTKLSDDDFSIVSLEAKLGERLKKVEESEKLLKAAQKEKGSILTSESQKLNAVRTEVEWKLQCLEPRERNVEETVSKGTQLLSEVESVKADGRARQHVLLAKQEEVVQAFRYYKETVRPVLQKVIDMEKETSGAVSAPAPV